MATAMWQPSNTNVTHITNAIVCSSILRRGQTPYSEWSLIVNNYTYNSSNMNAAFIVS